VGVESDGSRVARRVSRVAGVISRFALLAEAKGLA
jgi:hypothetical protein